MINKRCLLCFDSGDLLGQSINGLGSLLQMPYGCGEQNMLNFAPDVYILKYLETTGQSVGSVYNDAMQFISAGLLFLFINSLLAEATKL